MASVRRLAAIMFTDIAGFTTLTQTDEAGALRLLQEQENLVGPLLLAHRGRKVKSMGDGLLIEFPNALDALECGVNLQRKVHEHNAAKGAHPLQVRVGIHLGDVQHQGSDILGDAVNIASRVEPLAEPGGVCLSAQVFDQVHNKVAYPLEKLGPKTLKGVRQPVEIYRVVFPWSGKVAPAGPFLPRLAVLPLANISPDPKDEYFADGLTEELISVVSQIKGLRVISHTSVNQYKGTTKTVSQIGSELGADAVLEGSVRKAGDQLRIAVQLIDARTDEHRWAQTYDRKLENVFAIQADVAERTAGLLKVEMLRAEREALAGRPTSNLDAYESYLRGIEAVRRFDGSLGSDEEALRYFEDALHKDSSFSAAYSHLADFLLQISLVSRPSTSVLPRARSLAQRAIELNPKSSEAHTVRGNLAMRADRDWALAEAELNQAIELNPSDSFARLWYGLLLFALQRNEEAKDQLRSAIELDPLMLLPRLTLASVLEREGDLKSAIALLEKSLESFGELPPLRWNLALAYALAGRVEDAVRLVDPLAGAPDLLLRGMRSAVLAIAGRPDELRTLLTEWEQQPASRYIPLSFVASGYVLVGENERALAILERGFREGDQDLWVSYQFPVFDAIRNHPRFVELIRGLNLPSGKDGSAEATSSSD